MMTRRDLLATGGAAAVTLALFGAGGLAGAGKAARGRFPLTLSEAEWRRRLTPAQFAVLREEETERPGSSPLNREHRTGTFVCAGCALPLFSSRTKFDSGTGWPSFWRPLRNAVGERRDASFGMIRTEVHCTRCGGHLGHVFNDGPRPTGLRYCMNGTAMRFRAA